MEYLAAVIVVIFVVAVAMRFLEALLRTRVPAYRLRSSLVTRAERSFLGVLDSAVAGRYRVFAKVRVEDVLQAPSTSDRRRHAAARNRIKSKHFDFVLCNPTDLAFVAAIELDDKSHLRHSRIKRDQFLNDACAGAGLPLVRIMARRSYTISDIRSDLSHLLPDVTVPDAVRT
ncbi:MAG: DUF2726 domain-containing protein [Xanthomonadaceae bacterium]|nr:DUF2726 domain-containing protein [Xanthomonadaceae bacterium]